MTIVGIIGILITLSALSVAGAGRSRQKTVIFFLLFLLHIAASTAYYFYALSAGSDAQMYYNDPYGIRYEQGLGTIFVVNFVQSLKESLGGSLYDYFILFQAFGFWGLVFVWKAFEEVFEEFEVPPPYYVLILLFLPGLHFWTAAIGKDAPLFLAVVLAVWATMRLSRRIPAFAIAIIIMMLFRPHIALLALGTLTLALLLDANTRGWIKISILTAILLGIGTVMAGVEATFMVDLSSTSALDEFLSKDVDEGSGADLTLVGASFPMKLFSLLFRPFFYDTAEAMGYVASAENLVLLFIFGFIFRHFGLTLTLSWKILYIRFSILFFLALTILLTIVNYNVGLGLRQKMMIMPCVLTVLATVVAVRLARRSLGEQQHLSGIASASALHTRPLPH